MIYEQLIFLTSVTFRTVCYIGSLTSLVVVVRLFDVQWTFLLDTASFCVLGLDASL